MTQVEKVNTVLKTVVSVGLVMGMVAGLWAALNQGAQAAQKADVARLESVDASIQRHEALTDQRIDKLITVVEINSTLMVEPKGSPQYFAAVSKLRAMRRVVND
jgi:hypothetical protein